MKDNIKILENLLTNWVDASTDLLNIETAIFIKSGEEEINKKVKETKESLASRAVKYGLKYDEIESRYGLNENEEGNLLGDYKNNLISLNNIYKKAYKAVINARAETTVELKKLLTVIIKLMSEKINIEQSNIDYQKHERKLNKLTEKAKEAIEKGNQNDALELSNKILEEKEKNPLKNIIADLNYLVSQIGIYDEIISDCEDKMKEYYDERKSKFDKSIIIEPVKDKELTTQRKGLFRRKRGI